MTHISVQRVADYVGEVGSKVIADMTGIKKGRVARFPNDPYSITIPDLERIKIALRSLGKDV